LLDAYEGLKQREATIPAQGEVRLTVNLVAWPEQPYLIPAWAEMFRSHGLSQV
jgi:hypothetical protein